MLFNSFVFIFGFLPIALVLFYGPGRWKSVAKLSLTVMSLGFYAWWRPIHLPLLLGSIIFNFVVGDRIQKAYDADRSMLVKIWLIFGLAVDVGLLGWFKYANFVVDNVNLATGAGIQVERIILPLAISFFTFQKVAYLIDSARGHAHRMSFLDFSLFASFFPQLIAGPIVHYKEIVPQIQGPLFARWIGRNMMIGLMIFAIGLFKKTVIADPLSDQVDKLFKLAVSGDPVSIWTGWMAAITFTLQLYFDFSGYSDMAIGLARMFGIKLPLNFHSPLRAASVIDYWRRWHMTLQRFITAYIFQPLALPMARAAAARGLSTWPAFAMATVLPTFLTFVIIGIWHGAGWTFVLFGVLHAIYVCVNEYWRARRNQKRRRLRKLKQTMPEPRVAEIASYHIITLLAVMFANVVFRAPTVHDAMTVWQAMVGLGGSLSAETAPWVFDTTTILMIVVGTLLIAFTPNTQQIMGRFNPAYNWGDWKDEAPALLRWQWRPSTLGIVYGGVILFFGLMFIQRGQTIFLYFNF